MITNLDDVWLTACPDNGADGAAIRGRRQYRLKMVAGIGVSYAVDIVILTLFVVAGTITAVVPLVCAAAGLIHVAIFGLLHWTGMSDRARNPHLTVWQMSYAIGVQLMGMLIAPAVAMYFLALMFVIFGFATLRLSIRQALAMWLLVCLVTGFVLVDFSASNLAPVIGDTFVAVIVWVAFASILLRSILLGYYASALRVRFFRDNLHLADEIAERKREEAELEQHRQHLEEVVYERTAALSVAKDAAEAANRAKTAFLSNMSHELRTPLNAIMGMNDLASRRATDPRQIEFLSRVREASQRLLTLVTDVLEYTRIEADQLTLEEDWFSLAQVIDEAVRVQEEAAHAKNLQLRREIAPGLPDRLYGDASRLSQMLRHYISNAVKFSDAGTITVSVRAGEEDSLCLVLRVEVADQGIGIGAGQQARLFQLFTQADDSSTRRYGGTGLGLALVKRIAELMGGEVGVSSREGLGSTFWATVRLRRATAADETGGAARG
jgi:signal transduction histidine kinase